MRAISLFILGAALVFTASKIHAEQGRQEKMMEVEGRFDISLEPQEDKETPAGRMLIRKEYIGGLAGNGLGQMLSKRTPSGTAAYSAVEEFSGKLDGKTGTFTLIHQGFMSAEKQELEIYILEGSGTEELATISGTLEIIKEAGTHKYILRYKL